MTWRLLSAHDDGRRTDVKFDDQGRIIVRTQEEVDPVLESNHQHRLNGDHRRMGGDWHFVATVPNVIALKWLQEDGINIWDGEHQDGLARKLNDPDWAYLRTGGGRIGVSNGVAR